jgi:hypothetical protein
VWTILASAPVFRRTARFANTLPSAGGAFRRGDTAVHNASARHKPELCGDCQIGWITSRQWRINSRQWRGRPEPHSPRPSRPSLQVRRSLRQLRRRVPRGFQVRRSQLAGHYPFIDSPELLAACHQEIGTSSPLPLSRYSAGPGAKKARQPKPAGPKSVSGLTYQSSPP